MLNHSLPPLANYDSFQEFFKLHCNATNYVFQVKKCTSAECIFCSSHPLGMDFLPVPMLDSNKEHNRSFEERYGTKTTEADRPNLNLKMTTTEEEIKFKSVLVATKVCGIITCIDC